MGDGVVFTRGLNEKPEPSQLGATCISALCSILSESVAHRSIDSNP